MIRATLDVIIFFARNMVLAFAVFGLAWLLLSRRRPFAVARPREGLIWWSSIVVLAIYVAIAVWYVTLDGFAGEVEPIVSTLSWLVESGHPLYTSMDSAERYSVLYGPSVFLTNGLFLKILGPSIVSVKLASAIAAVGSPLFLYAALARRRRDAMALAMAAAVALYFWAQGFAVYVVRPDALMVFALSLGLFGAARLRLGLAVTVVAATAGFAINLKVHGFLYFLPVVAVLAGRFGRRAVAWAIVGAAAVVALPFVFNPQVSLVHYLAWLGNGMSHGLTAEFLALDLGYAAFLLLPVVVLLWLGGWRRWRGTSEGVLILTLLSVFPAILVLASKPGAGMVHLLPLVLPTIYIVGRLVMRLQSEHFTWQPRIRQAAIAAFALTVVLAGSVNEYRAVRLLDWQLKQTPELANDLRQIMARYGGLTVAMACGGENFASRCTWPRPLLAFGDNPVLVDPISVMDSSLSGRELSPETYRALDEGRIAVWLVPRGQEPFRKVNWYAPHSPIFPEAFLRRFEACYSPRASSRYFDLWFWNGLAVAAAGAPLPATLTGLPSVLMR